VSLNERSLAIHPNLRPNLVPSSSEVLLRRRTSNRGRGSERGRMADRLQASMQEMPQAMDLHGRNLPRGPNLGLRTKNVNPSNGRRDLEPDPRSSKVRFSAKKNAPSKAPTIQIDLRRVRRFIRSSRLCPRALSGRVHSLGSLRIAYEYQSN